MRVLVAYDICDPKRISRVAKIILDYGERVLKSVYEVHVSKRSLQELMRRIAREIEPSEDGVKFYLLCGRCQDKIEMFGIGQTMVAEETVVIV